MVFTNITTEEFNNFINTHEQSNFSQTVELANLKEKYGYKTHLVGLKDKDKVVAATLIIEKRKILNKTIFYAPRGFIIDYNNYELLSKFTNEIKKYILKNNGLMLTIDPNVIYRMRSNKGEIIDNVANDIAINNLIKLDYKHFGFNLNFETNQVRWSCIIDINGDYESISNNFNKSTMKNINTCIRKGLIIKTAQESDLPIFTSILKQTAVRKGFEHRSLQYYKDFYNYLNKYSVFYIAYIDPKLYYYNTLTKLNEEKEKLDRKINKQASISSDLIIKYQKELEEAHQMLNKCPNLIPIGALLSMKSGNEYITLFSGYIEKYRNFMPKYLLYNQHIKDALTFGIKRINFYGISGDFNKNNKHYNIYEFKKGFGVSVVELIGEFQLIVDNKYYYLYKTLSLIKKHLNLLKNLIKKNKKPN